MSAGLPPANSALRLSRAALRPSLVEKSATTALISALALESVATFVSAAPPANDSFKRPQSPLGSAAVIAIPAIMGLFKSSVHSSFVKLVLSAIDNPPHIHPMLGIGQSVCCALQAFRQRSCLEQTALRDLKFRLAIA